MELTLRCINNEDAENGSKNVKYLEVNKLYKAKTRGVGRYEVITPSGEYIFFKWRFEVVDDSLLKQEATKTISDLFEEKVKAMQMEGKSLTIRQLQEGDKVHYKKFNFIENGIVKTVWPTGEIWVVYHCANEWENYRNYTGILTPLKYLKLGWYENQDNGM